MKKLKLIFGILIGILISSYMNAQEYVLEEKVVTGIFEIKKKNKSELYSSINKWISINYNSAKNVIQMNDKESGTIIIKGINEVTYKNTMKILSPNNKLVMDFAKMKFNHLIEINIKDNRYRVIFRITDIINEVPGNILLTSKYYGPNTLIFKGINFNGTNEESIRQYDEFMEKFLKSGFIGKKKRAAFKLLSKPMFEDLNTCIVNNIKLTLKSIEQSINEKAKDDW